MFQNAKHEDHVHVSHIQCFYNFRTDFPFEQIVYVRCEIIHVFISHASLLS